MPPLYIGNPGSVDPIIKGPYGRDNPSGTLAGPVRLPMSSAGAGKSANMPSVIPPSPAPTRSPGSVLPAQSLRASGPSQGFDPQYLQNLTTAIGGLFSRPQGNLSFNPLGNLSDISSPGLGFGNAPLPGLPSTMLQDAINGLAFMFNQPQASGGGGGNPILGNNGDGGNRGGGRGGYPLA